MVERIQISPILTGITGLASGASAPRQPGAASQLAPSTSFQNTLRACLGREPQVQFSDHAASRLQQRDIQLNDRDVTRLENAVSQAERKGGKESLILMNDLAFIVSIRNRTIVTALDTTASQSKVFTNIDSVVMAR
jgi:flagellar operon protein